MTSPHDDVTRHPAPVVRAIPPTAHGAHEAVAAWCEIHRDGRAVTIVITTSNQSTRRRRGRTVRRASRGGERAVRDPRQGGQGPLTTLVCGTARFDHPAARQLVSLLPAVISVDASSSHHAEWIQSTLRFMAGEARELRPGGETVITRLADVLVIQAIRLWIERDPAAQTGWLAALRDKQVGRALTLIHRSPARPWTLDLLASSESLPARHGLVSAR